MSEPVFLQGWDYIRRQRDLILAQCDWTQLLDAALTSEERTAWQDYRQALRDIPQNFADPSLVIWPPPPGG